MSSAEAGEALANSPPTVSAMAAPRASLGRVLLIGQAPFTTQPRPFSSYATTIHPLAVRFSVTWMVVVWGSAGFTGLPWASSTRDPFMSAHSWTVAVDAAGVAEVLVNRGSAGPRTIGPFLVCFCWSRRAKKRWKTPLAPAAGPLARA